MFPPEIVDAIVDNLQLPSDGAFDLTMTILPTLLACSLTSRSFAAAARRRLFSTITLGIYKRQLLSSFMEGRSKDVMGLRIKALTDLLAYDGLSDLVLMVQKLEINVDHEGFILAPESNIELLLTILRQRADNLKALCLQSQVRELFWTKIPAGTAELLMDLYRTLPISVLKFTGIVGIPSSLATKHHCPHLTDLNLRNSKFVIATSATNVVGAAVVQYGIAPSLLRSGRFRVRYGSEENLLLTGLDVQVVYAEHAEQLPVLMRHASQSLEIFGCFLTDYQSQSLPRIASEIREMTQLRKIQVQRVTPVEDIESAILEVADLLHHENKTSILEEVIFFFHTRTQYERLDDLTHVNYDSLKSFTFDVLREQHPLIRKVIFTFEIGCYSQTRNPEPHPNHLRGLEEQYRTHIINAITTDVPGTAFSTFCVIPEVRVRITDRRH